MLLQQALLGAGHSTLAVIKPAQLKLRRFQKTLLSPQETDQSSKGQFSQNLLHISIEIIFKLNSNVATVL